MSRFIRLERDNGSDDGAALYIRPEDVRRVAILDDLSTQIVMADGARLVVLEGAAEVADLLNREVQA